MVAEPIVIPPVLIFKLPELILTLLAKSDVELTSIAPPNVVIPVTFILTAVVIPFNLVCADVRIPVTFT